LIIWIGFNSGLEIVMTRLTALMLGGTLVVLAGTPAAAQTKVIPGEHRTSKATVETVDLESRTVMLRNDKGELKTVHAPAQATRLAEIHAGDIVTATYYDNIVLRVKAAAEPDVDTHEIALTPGTGPQPAGTSGSQQTITALIDAIDLNEPSISFRGPRGWTYATKVQDKKALEQVKVGDRVDITWTAATLVSVGAAKP
jgi:hypothetical protein